MNICSKQGIKNVHLLIALIGQVVAHGSCKLKWLRKITWKHFQKLANEHHHLLPPASVVELVESVPSVQHVYPGFEFTWKIYFPVEKLIQNLLPEQMKQLDVDVSPPCFTLTHVTFDLDARDLYPQVTCQIHEWKMHENHVFWHGDLDLWPMTLTFISNLESINVYNHTKFGDPNSNGSWDMNYCPVISVQSRTDRRKVTPKSPLCLRTGGLNKKTQYLLALAQQVVCHLPGTLWGVGIEMWLLWCRNCSEAPTL